MPRQVEAITGAGSGIGAAISARFAADHDLILTHLADDEDLARTSRHTSDCGARITSVVGDLTDARTRQDFARAIHAHRDQLDVLVCNAGAYPRIPWAELSMERFRASIELNLTSHLACIRAAAPTMIHRGRGRIIAISSVLTQLGRVDLAAYIAAKSGLEGLVRALARELGPHNITVNAVRAGSIEVDAERLVVPDPGPMVVRQLDRQCIKRRGQPSDIAAAVAFLASPDAGFITGQHLTVDGGWHLS